jgi:hypothetical protein
MTTLISANKQDKIKTLILLDILVPNLANESATYKTRKKYQFDQYLGFLKTKLAL